jgi:hypothetical protein
MLDRLSIRLFAVTGVGGVVLAHAADYLAVYPHTHERNAHLEATGHSYWPIAATLAVIAGLATIATAARRGWRAGRRRSRPATIDLFGSAMVLAAWQLLLFVGMETVERAAAGVSPLELGYSPEFWVGLVAQVIVALVAVLLVRGANRVAHRLGRASRPRTQTQRSVGWPAAREATARSRTNRPWQSRAPPLALA